MRLLKNPSPLPGPKKLLAHIRAQGISVPDWCAEHDLARHSIEKAIKGRLAMTVALAEKLARATDGAVLVADWSEGCGHAQS